MPSTTKTGCQVLNNRRSSDCFVYYAPVNCGFRHHKRKRTNGSSCAGQFAEEKTHKNAKNAQRIANGNNKWAKHELRTEWRHVKMVRQSHVAWLLMEWVSERSHVWIRALQYNRRSSMQYSNSQRQPQQLTIQTTHQRTINWNVINSQQNDRHMKTYDSRSSIMNITSANRCGLCMWS